jgi:hypothetical protein
MDNFSSVYGITTKGNYPYLKVIKAISAMAAAVLCCWMLGGIIALGLSVLSPEFYRHAFIGVPEDFYQMLSYAWVGGSIWGGLFGGILSGILGSIIFANQVKKEKTKST